MSFMTTQTVKILNGNSASEWFRIGDSERGAYQCPGTLTGTTITVEISNDAGGTGVAAGASTGENNPQTIAANGTYPIPRLAFNALYARLKSNATESGERVFTITKASA